MRFWSIGREFGHWRGSDRRSQHGYTLPMYGVSQAVRCFAASRQRAVALVLMPVASCDGESLLGSVEVRTWKGTEPMSVCDSGSGGQGCKHSVPRAVRAGRRWNVTCRLRLSSHWNYKRKFTEFWTDLFGCHVPGSVESCCASSGKSAQSCDRQWPNMDRSGQCHVPGSVCKSWKTLM